MSLYSLLRKEVAWSRRHVLILLFLLVALPLFFAGTSFLFQSVIPRDVPVAVVPENQQVADYETGVVRTGMSPYTNPRLVESKQTATKMLEREQVYAIVTVPPDFQSGKATFRLTIHGSVVPFQEPSEVIQDLVTTELNQIQNVDISIEREVLGDRKKLPEYLLPSFLMTLVIFFAFTYVPYSLGRDETVLDRLRVETSIEMLVASKIIYLTALMLVPILVFHGIATLYSYSIASFAPGAVFVLLLTFALLGTISSAVVFLTQFSSAGRFLNLLVMLGLIALSGLAFPLGFFSPVRTQIAQLLPTHYAMITVRSLMLKESTVAMFADWIAMLCGVWLLSLVALKGSIVYYRRET